MKYTLTTTAVILAMTAAANAQTVWQGDLFVTAVTSACNSPVVALNVGDFIQAILAPKNLSGNGSSDSLNVFLPRGAAYNIVPQNGTLNAATAFKLVGIHHDGTAGSSTPSSQGPFSVSPSTIASVTPSVTLSFTWHGYDGVSGCSVSFQGVLTRRPGNINQ